MTRTGPSTATAGGPVALWTAVLVSAHTLWTSAASALVYRLYARDWGLAPTTTATLFAVYPLAVVLTLAVSGDLADHVGRRRAMSLGIMASLFGAVLLAIAPGPGTVLAARLVMGVGVGLSAGPSTAAIVEYLPASAQHWGAVVTTLAQSAGFALPLVVGGVVLQFSPLLIGPQYWLLSVGLIALAILVRRLPVDRPIHETAWRPRWPVVPHQGRSTFVLAGAAIMVAMVHGVVVLSLGGQIAHDLVGSANPALDGAILALFAVAGGITSVAARGLKDRVAIIVGGIVAVAGMGTLLIAIGARDLCVYAASTIVAGTGYALLFRGGIDLGASLATASDRAGVLSTLYLAGYGAMAAFAIALGAVSMRIGLDRSITSGCVAIVVTAAFVSIAAAKSSRRGSPAVSGLDRGPTIACK